MSTATRWWWIRHAPVPDGGRIYGQRDLDCDCSDTETFRILARELPRDAVWVTSNLVRTRQTAAAILAAAEADRFADVAPVAVRELAEQHLGEWQGQERKAFYAARRVGTHTLWFAPADERPPGGENFSDLVQRVAPAIARLNLEHRGRDIVAVTHGGTIRAALGLALGLTPQTSLAFSVENCSLTRLDHLTADGGLGLWRVIAVNHRPWSRAPAGEHPGHNPVAIDKA
ncbi:MAG: histidine phosphatase family protein [Hyphomonadaceae bacterium]|jgi:broad specificity phosphatase PhoE|nr:histidine phosphatase family protein [Hyphomonadaceae bacterium]